MYNSNRHSRTETNMNLWWKRSSGWPGERFFCCPEALIPKLATLSHDATKLYLGVLLACHSRNATIVPVSVKLRLTIGLTPEDIVPASDELLAAGLIRYFPMAGVYGLLTDTGSPLPPLDDRNEQGNHCGKPVDGNRAESPVQRPSQQQSEA